MFQKSLVAGTLLGFALSLASAADSPAPQAKLTASEIVDKNVAARGGLQSWRSVQTMSLAGKLTAGGNQRAALPVPGAERRSAGVHRPTDNRPLEEVQLPFVMDLKRPRKSRFELTFNGQTAVQVFDGVNGWKLRPFLNRRDVESFTPEEAKAAALQSDLDGPLVDYAAKGTTVALDGLEKVEDRDNYKLTLTMKNGQTIHVWIDAQTFLETKIEGSPRRLDGVYHPVEVYFRDYREVNGLRVPYLLETKVLPVARTKMGLRESSFPTEKIMIEKVTVNSKFDDVLFTKPVVEVASNK